jgi:voltage-gated potassium channel
MLDPTAWPRAGLSPLNRAVVLLILVSVAGAVLESEPLLYEGRERFWFGIEVGFAFIFLVEYLARLWICVESPSYRGAVRGWLAYAFSPAARLDLIAVVPLIFAFAGTEAFLLRFFRMARILRLARLGRFSLAMLALRDGDRVTAIRAPDEPLRRRRDAAGLVDPALHRRERHAAGRLRQHPRAMWWSIATLTTVGYGDVFR